MVRIRFFDFWCPLFLPTSKSLQGASFSLLTGVGLSYAIKGFNDDPRIILTAFLVGSAIAFAFVSYDAHKKRGPKFRYFEPGTTATIVLVNDKIALGKLQDGQTFAVQTVDNLGNEHKPPQGLVLGESYEVESYYVPGDFLIVKIPTMTA